MISHGPISRTAEDLNLFALSDPLIHQREIKLSENSKLKRGALDEDAMFAYLRQ
jgi:hypothetical protein